MDYQLNNVADSLSALLTQYNTSITGLSSQEAKRRLAEYGSNQMRFHRIRSPLMMFISEFKAWFPLLLLMSSLLAYMAHRLSPGEGYNIIAVALFGVVILNAIVSFLQNYKVEKIMVAFLDYIPKQVNVLRNGEINQIEAKLLVPGDLLLIQQGDKISADGIILFAHDLLLDESIISGESVAVEKAGFEGVIDENYRAYSGATVTRGDAKILITETGRNSKIGSISELSQKVKRDLTPMQKELEDFVHKITYLALGIGSVFFISGFLIGNTFWTNLIFAIGIIVANVPEGLLPTVTLALTQASVRMGKCNAIVKDILSVETLGSTTVICTDKTGTLTKNQLHVESIYMDLKSLHIDSLNEIQNYRGINTLLEIMALCNAVIISQDDNGKYNLTGDPTEIAIANFVDQLDSFSKIRERFDLKHELPFDAVSRMMASTYLTSGGNLYMTVKGATQTIINRCTQLHNEGLVCPLRALERQKIIKQSDKYAAQGLRVLALAYQVVDHEDMEPQNLIFVGLVAFVDPPHKEVAAAVAACKSAGIRVIVVSGDKAETVAYIAKRLRIVDQPKIIEGHQLAVLSQEQLVQTLHQEQVVFARIAPEQKLTIVEALKSMNEVVAMTGDGVNDAPALKRADIGIAMGRKGTDVAKEASDIILLDDNFATIVKAIEQGRAVYDNIKKFITYILTSNIPEILPFIAYVLFPIPLPITVVQILAIDLITDILPAIGLGNEPPESDIMQRPPRPTDEHLVTYKTFIRSYAIVGPLEALLSFIAFFVVLYRGGWEYGDRMSTLDPLYLQAASAFLVTIIFSQIGNVMACRTNRQTALPYFWKFNPWILGGVIFELIFVFVIVYLPQFHAFFKTSPIALMIWPIILVAPLLIIAIEELRKWLVRKGIQFLSA